MASQLSTKVSFGGRQLLSSSSSSSAFSSRLFSPISQCNISVRHSSNSAPPVAPVRASSRVGRQAARPQPITDYRVFNQRQALLRGHRTSGAGENMKSVDLTPDHLELNRLGLQFGLPPMPTLQDRENKYTSEQDYYDRRDARIREHLDRLLRMKSLSKKEMLILIDQIEQSKWSVDRVSRQYLKPFFRADDQERRDKIIKMQAAMGKKGEEGQGDKKEDDENVKFQAPDQFDYLSPYLIFEPESRHLSHLEGAFKYEDRYVLYEKERAMIKEVMEKLGEKYSPADRPFKMKYLTRQGKKADHSGDAAVIAKARRRAARRSLNEYVGRFMTTEDQSVGRLADEGLHYMQVPEEAGKAYPTSIARKISDLFSRRARLAINSMLRKAVTKRHRHSMEKALDYKVLEKYISVNGNISPADLLKIERELVEFAKALGERFNPTDLREVAHQHTRVVTDAENDPTYAERYALQLSEFKTANQEDFDMPNFGASDEWVKQVTEWEKTNNPTAQAQKQEKEEQDKRWKEELSNWIDYQHRMISEELVDMVKRGEIKSIEEVNENHIELAKKRVSQSLFASDKQYTHWSLRPAEVSEADIEGGNGTGVGVAGSGSKKSIMVGGVNLADPKQRGLLLERLREKRKADEQQAELFDPVIKLLSEHVENRALGLTPAEMESIKAAEEAGGFGFQDDDFRLHDPLIMKRDDESSNRGGRDPMDDPISNPYTWAREEDMARRRKNYLDLDPFSPDNADMRRDFDDRYFHFDEEDYAFRKRVDPDSDHQKPLSMETRYNIHERQQVPIRYDLSDDAIELLYLLHRSDPAKWTPRALARHFKLSVPRVRGHLTMQSIHYRMMEQNVPHPLAFDFDEDTALEELIRPTRLAIHDPPNLPRADLPDWRFVKEEDMSKVIAEDQAVQERFLSKSQLADKRESEYFARAGAIGVPSQKAAAPPAILDERLVAPARHGMVFVDLSEAKADRFAIAVRDRSGILREPTPQEFYFVKAREKGTHRFQYIQYHKEQAPM